MSSLIFSTLNPQPNTLNFLKDPAETAPWRQPEMGRRRATRRSVSVESKDCSRVDIRDLRYESVNLGAGKRPNRLMRNWDSPPAGSRGQTLEEPEEAQPEARPQALQKGARSRGSGSGFWVQLVAIGM